MRPRLRDISRRRGPTAGPFRGESARADCEPCVLAERHLAAGGGDPVRQDQVCAFRMTRLEERLTGIFFQMSGAEGFQPRGSGRWYVRGSDTYRSQIHNDVLSLRSQSKSCVTRTHTRACAQRWQKTIDTRIRTLFTYSGKEIGPFQRRICLDRSPGTAARILLSIGFKVRGTGSA